MRLRQDFLDLDVATVEAEKVAAPPGARGVDLQALGSLIVIGAQSKVLGSVVEAIRAWIAGTAQRSAKVEIDGDTLELTGLSTVDQRRLIDDWLQRHAAS